MSCQTSLACLLVIRIGSKSAEKQGDVLVSVPRHRHCYAGRLKYGFVNGEIFKHVRIQAASEGHCSVGNAGTVDVSQNEVRGKDGQAIWVIFGEGLDAFEESLRGRVLLVVLAETQDGTIVDNNDGYLSALSYRYV